MPAWTRNSSIYIIFRCQQKLSHHLVVRVIGQLLWWAFSKTVLPTPASYASKHLSTCQGHLRQVTFHPIEKRLSAWLSAQQGSWIWDGCHCRALPLWRRLSAFDLVDISGVQAGDPWDIRIYNYLLAVDVKCGYNDAREISSLQLVSFTGRSSLATVPYRCYTSSGFFQPSSLCGYHLSSTRINTLNVLSTTQYTFICYILRQDPVYLSQCYIHDASDDANQEGRLKTEATDGAIWVKGWWGCWQDLGVVTLVAHHRTKYPRRLYYRFPWPFQPKLAYQILLSPPHM